MSNESATTGATRGRPRSDQVDRAILHAASALLAERGLDAMTIEDVAARAGVGKSSIYRRWPTKGTLALDAFLDSFLAQQPRVDTGALEEDLAEALTLWSAAVVGTPTGRALVGLIAESQLDQELARGWIERVMKPVRAQHRTMVERAIERGEIPVELRRRRHHGPALRRGLSPTPAGSPRDHAGLHRDRRANGGPGREVRCRRGATNALAPTSYGRPRSRAGVAFAAVSWRGPWPRLRSPGRPA